MDFEQMHVTGASQESSSNRGNFKIKLPTVDIQDCSDLNVQINEEPDEFEAELNMVHSPTSTRCLLALVFWQNSPLLLKGSCWEISLDFNPILRKFRQRNE